MRATDSRACSWSAESSQRNLEIFALANVGDAGEAEQFDRMLDGFALRIEHARFQTDVNFRFHFVLTPWGPRI